MVWSWWLPLLVGTSGLPMPAQAPLVTATSNAYRGQRIDLELQDADIHQVLRMFSEIGRVNIIAEPGVSGKVTARFTSTPWDEAFAHVLASLHLEAMRDGNVITVCPKH